MSTVRIKEVEETLHSDTYYNMRGNNPLDKRGKITRCQLCDSINHLEPDCSDKL